VIDRATGAPLAPLPFDAPLLADGDFVWGGERWLTSRASLDEPPLDLVAAAPVTPFAQPFQRAARRGVAALGLVLIAALVTTVLLTRKTTQALRDLAHAATEISKGHYERTVATDADDEVGQVAGAFNTMTASLRRTLDELAERRSFAAVGEFASSLAHEVRNPLTSIRLDLQRLEEKVAGDPRLSEPVARALRSVVRLDATVTGVLRVARSGQLNVDRVDVREPLDAALKDAESESRARGVLLTCEDADADVWITGDRSALHQLFLNLVLNAVQATKAGGRVHVGATVETDVVRVSISDSGAGIAAETQNRVFDSFYSTKIDGTGLGLTIARRIAEAHGGSITLESHAGHGTTALVRLPLRSDA
jgi:signal transduction histidine kinase